MAIDLRSFSPRTSFLNDQIREAGDRLRKRRRLVRVRGATLRRTLHQRITDPAWLLWAGGVGFLMGELTGRQTPHSPQGTDRSPDSGPPLFETTLNLIKLIDWGHTLFKVLLGAGTPPREPSIPLR